MVTRTAVVAAPNQRLVQQTTIDLPFTAKKKKRWPGKSHDTAATVVKLIPVNVSKGGRLGIWDVRLKRSICF